MDLGNDRELEQQVDEVTPLAIAIRRELHKWPETGNEEYKTIERIKNELLSIGVPTKQLLNTGLVATISSSNSQTDSPPVIAFRADMDGLPIKEKISLPFSSARNGYMHACGHDVHMAILIGTAMVLQRMRDRPFGIVKFVFQPAEETTGGAERMIAAGCLGSPDVSQIYGLHVKPDLVAGMVGFAYGKVHASSDQFQIRVIGKSSHGAAPEAGIDALVAGSQIVSNLQTIVSRSVSPLESAVITIGSFHSGTAGNILADEAVLVGTIRAYEPTLREHLLQKVKEVSEWTARAMGAQAVVEFTPGYDALLNWNEQVDLVKELAIELLGKEQVKVIEKTSMGVDDFAYYLKKTQGAYFFLGSGFSHRENPPLHSDRFYVNEACIRIGIYLLSSLALRQESKK